MTRLCAASVILCGALGCGPPPAKQGPRSPAAFTDVTEQAGLTLQAVRAAPGDYFMPDSLAAGCAFLDYDVDGDLDVYVVQGARAGRQASSANRLFRQRADGSFADVTRVSGAGDPGYGMGVAVGDVDHNGFPDLYVTNFGPDVLLLNQGDGTFADSTVAAGLGDSRWGASAGFLDYDGDGWLDLFVTHYVDYDPALRVTDSGGRPDYPGPECCPGAADALYRNQGAGHFVDVSERSGIAGARGKGLGLAFGDFDGDGRPDDIFVANDGEANHMWLQREPGRFSESAAQIGVAVNVYGAAEASMGVAAADLNDDGFVDLFVTHLVRETNTLYLGGPTGGYRDATLGSGLGPPSLPFTGFGTAFLDFDLDGDLDLAVANGRVLRAPLRAGARADTHWGPYAEPSQVFENTGDGRFAEAAERCGALCAEPRVGRGLAVGDFDNDGDEDLLVSSADGTVRLWRNDLERVGHWLGVEAVDGDPRRPAHGAVVRLDVDGRSLTRRVDPAGSYLSSHDPRARFGLARHAEVERVIVRWPDRTAETFEVGLDRYHRLVRGSGRTAP